VSHLFTVLAGKSSDTFKLGGVEFQAAPVTLREYGEYLAIEKQPIQVQATWLADKLGRRLQNTTKSDLPEITDEWVLDNLPLPFLKIVQHILLYGEMPKEGGEKKA